MRVTLIESPGRSPLVTARTGYSTAANLDNRKTTGDVRSCESAASEAAAPRSLNRCRRASATPARARARARPHAHRRRLRTRRGSRPVAVQAVGVTAGNVRTSRSIAPPTSVVVIVMSPTVITLACSAVTHVPSATAIGATSDAFVMRCPSAPDGPVHDRSPARRCGALVSGWKNLLPPRAVARVLGAI